MSALPRIAVEQSLSHIAEMLRSNGYDVVDLGNRQQTVDAVVITGLDENIMGVENKTFAGAPVISAEGLTAEEVFHEVHERCSPTSHHS